MCSSVLCAFSANIYVPHFPVYSKAIQYVFTLLHVLSKPRGPPARKSSHFPNRFLFPTPCTVRSSFFHIISSFHPVFCLFSTVYDRTTVRTSYVSYVPYEIFQKFKFNMTYCTHVHARFLCPIYSTPFDVSYVPYESNSQSKKAHQ